MTNFTLAASRIDMSSNGMAAEEPNPGAVNRSLDAAIEAQQDHVLSRIALWLDADKRRQVERLRNARRPTAGA